MLLRLTVKPITLASISFQLAGEILRAWLLSYVVYACLIFQVSPTAQIGVPTLCALSLVIRDSSSGSGNIFSCSSIMIPDPWEEGMTSMALSFGAETSLASLSLHIEQLWVSVDAVHL